MPVAAILPSLIRSLPPIARSHHAHSPALRRWVASASAQAEKQQREYRLRRALFNGSEDRKLAAALRVGADSVVFDLEDGVAYPRKAEARVKVRGALDTFDLGKSEKAVRINSVGSGLEVDDMNAILPSPNLQAIVIPKCQTAQDVLFVADMVDRIAPESNRANVRFIVCVESALGLLNLREIAGADPRVDGIVFASEDYCADTGIRRTPSRRELQYARQCVSAHASAAGVQAIDLVCMDYKSEKVLEEECTEGREWGFTGKQAIHPLQVPLIHQHFSPTPAEIERAGRIVAGFAEHVAKGVGAFTLDGKMIDMPVVKWAEKVLAQDRFIKS
ncbi:beta subunit of citrate lyase [Gonapodya prolifera JEL478]|uniref:Beta subunit of citrate lyase n=1 Tax=Gonapodya prolifera (strain JEL478) TaxID=1344416 RepID=A0A139ANH0_GONPJ|nr:beta subunit of citrate lyase [Gonapodya prolifera JEL478]|eukprot:KXS18045.1 beta subunit of citrate lyase [Gonapodya prolifera JEL478]